jgi:hypothetical protein
MKKLSGVCIECVKWQRPNCSVLKQENQRPGPTDWCAAFKKNTKPAPPEMDGHGSVRP